MRKDFTLPEEDVAYLDSIGLNWETYRESNQEWLIVHDYCLPEGYNVSVVDVLINITSGYPIAPLDMAYFNPSLLKKDGSSIKATEAIITIDGKTWQRWSRHRTAQNPWQPGIDNIITHFLSIKYWLEREIK